MVENQTYLFIVFSLTGIGLGVLFDFFRALRKTFKTPDLVTYLEDIIYWILAGIIVLYNIWFFNDGEIRIYMILGILIGAVIYTLTLSTIFIKINYFIMSKIKIILTFISKIFKIIKPAAIRKPLVDIPKNLNKNCPEKVKASFNDHLERPKEAA